tara:strand:+ start:1206 stop:1322 length:117 start_codon:yes stop_codon:yes gene_type:complete
VAIAIQVVRGVFKDNLVATPRIVAIGDNNLRNNNEQHR